jgi:hypothetical protein
VAAGIPDVDGDGLADLVFDDGDPLAGLPAALYANDVRGVGDLDGDGVPDVGLSQCDADTCALLVFGAGGVEVARVEADTSVRVTPNAAGDVDGDGHGDLADGDGWIDLLFGWIDGADGEVPTGSLVIVYGGR